MHHLNPRLTRLNIALLSLCLAVVFMVLSSKSNTVGGRLSSLPRLSILGKPKLPAWPTWRIGASDSAEQAALRRWELSRATQYLGTGARVQRFLEKAKRGEPFTVAALGGSVSKGRGLSSPNDRTAHLRDAADKANGISGDDGDAYGADTLYSHENLHVLVYDWLNATFPNGGRNRFVNGAQGGVGAGYFAWCFKEHIYDDVDLVLVELGINDLNRMDVIPKYEHLIRSVVELDSAPAVINIETFTTLFPALVSSSALHNDVLAYYDVPSLSIRDILLPRILADPDTQLPRWFRTGGDVALGDDKVREWGGVPVDLMHISAKGHALAAGLVINYLSSQLSLVAPTGWTRLAPWRLRTERVYDLPSTSLTASFNPEDLPEKRSPVCRSMNSPKLHHRISDTDGTPDTASPHVRGLVLNPASKGWEQWAWAEKHYLVAREPGSLAIFDFVTAEPEAPAPLDEEMLPDPLDVYEPDHRTFAPYDEDDDTEWAAIEADESQPRHQKTTRVKRSGNGYLAGNRRMGGKQRMGDRVRAVPEATSSDDTEAPAPADGGTVAVGYQRSANYGLGSVFCWVDDDKHHGRRLDGYWTIKERNMGIVDAVTTGLAPGLHRLYCELLPDTLDPLGRHEFRMFAIMWS